MKHKILLLLLPILGLLLSPLSVFADTVPISHYVQLSTSANIDTPTTTGTFTVFLPVDVNTGMYDESTGIFTVPTNGVLQIHESVTITITPSGGSFDNNNTGIICVDTCTIYRSNERTPLSKLTPNRSGSTFGIGTTNSNRYYLTAGTQFRMQYQTTLTSGTPNTRIGANSFISFFFTQQTIDVDGASVPTEEIEYTNLLLQNILALAILVTSFGIIYKFLSWTVFPVIK